MSILEKTARHMLGNGWFNSARIQKELGITKRRATVIPHSLKDSAKYEIECKKDGRSLEVRVLSISENRTRPTYSDDTCTQYQSELWNLALFGKKLGVTA